jgi:hypothetical protein
LSSKKYKGKICVYCAVKPSTTADHVFARTFLAEDQQADLPRVAACTALNKVKSDLEHYLATALLFTGQHTGARDKMLKKMPGNFP